MSFPNTKEFEIHIEKAFYFIKLIKDTYSISNRTVEESYLSKIENEIIILKKIKLNNMTPNDAITQLNEIIPRYSKIVSSYPNETMLIYNTDEGDMTNITYAMMATFGELIGAVCVAFNLNVEQYIRLFQSYFEQYYNRNW